MGNRGRTAAGDVQVMSAGTGVRHAEYNLEDEATTLFQIWVQTDRPSAEPSWGAAKFPKADRSGRFVTLASGFAEDADALKINSAARVLGATLAKGESAELTLDPSHLARFLERMEAKRGRAPGLGWLASHPSTPAVSGWPTNETSPAQVGCSPTRHRASVVLPEPDMPTTATHWWPGTAKVRSLSTVLWP